MKAVGLKEVAEKAGVSIGSVSYVLNRTGLDKVGKEKQKRIIAAAEELGYTPSITAKGLKTGRNYLVGLMIDRINSSFVSDIIQGIEDVLIESEYALALLTNNPAVLKRRCYQSIIARLDGVITFPTKNESARKEIFKLHESKPFVAIAGKFYGNKMPHVYVDGVKIGKMAVKYIADKGYKNFVYIDFNDKARKNGVVKEAKKLNLPLNEKSIITASENSVKYGYQLFSEIIKSAKLPLGIFASSDYVASGVLAAAKEAGYRIPEDIGILGCDDTSICEIAYPSISSIGQPKYEQGKKAAELILNSINDKHVEDYVFEPYLASRQSC